MPPKAAGPSQGSAFALLAVEDPVSSDEERPTKSTPSGSATPAGKKGKARRRLLERERARKATSAAAHMPEPVPSKPAPSVEDATYSEAAVSSSSQADPVVDVPAQSVLANGAVDAKHDRSLSMSTERPVAKRAPPSSIDGDLSDATQWTTGAFSSTEDEGEADVSVDEPKPAPSTPPQTNGVASPDAPATPIAGAVASKVSNAAARGVSAIRTATPNTASLLPAAPTTPRASGGRREREPSATGSVRGRGEEKAASSLTVAKSEPNHGTDHAPATKRRSIIERTIFGFAMIGGFIACLLAGHVYMIVLVFALQTVVFGELVSLFDGTAKPHDYTAPGSDGHQHRAVSASRDRKRAEHDKWSKATSWYFFSVCNYFLYGESIIYYFKHIVKINVPLLAFARHHRFVSFLLYVLGFVGFVSTLRRNQLRRQFGLFGWIHMSLFLIVVSCHFIVNNILEGLIWFWVPASLVICNDVFAYVFGMTMGRTQLIALSPKKTVEGFVGAFFTTIVFGVFWGTLFMRSKYMICPAVNLGSSAFAPVDCQLNPVFLWRDFVLPSAITDQVFRFTGLRMGAIAWAPFQLHCIVLSVFASLIAPFGGFFASGFKRAFNIKDFGKSIPGHGGLTDRFDCQFLAGLFAYFYYTSLVRGPGDVTVASVLHTAIVALSASEQAELVKELTKHLARSALHV